MYADDTAAYARAEKKTEAARQRSAALAQCFLSPLECIKTDCMFFDQTSADPHVSAAGQRLKYVSEFQNLEIILDSSLTF